MLGQSFDFESSPVDWCESNYMVSPYIAEFYNTISNVPLIASSIAAINLSRGTKHPTVRDLRKIMLVVLFAGISSVYFHATLSFIGQLADELAILWAIALVTASFYPSSRFPLSTVRKRDNFKKAVYGTTLVVSILSVIYPWINAVCLIAFTIPLAYVASTQIEMSGHKRTFQLSYVTCVVWATAISIWAFDRALCHWWLHLGFPYLHSIFHVMIAINSVQAVTLFACMHAVNDLKTRVLVLKYWPWDKYQFLLPYLQVQTVL